MSKILIIEDEEAIADLERDYLELSGFEVEIANRGDVGLEKALNEDYDLIILDLMLPEVDGFDICRQVRQEKNIPIIMVSAKKDDIDKIRGLGLGADDYMTKPFSPSELVARVKAHMERYNRLVGSSAVKNDIIEIRGIKIDKTARRIWVNGEEKTFTTKEFDLLTFLAENPNRVFTKAELDSRVEIEYETYAKEINIEAKAMIDIATKQIIPAVIKYTTVLAESINSVKAVSAALDVSVQTSLLEKTSALLAETKTAMDKLSGLIAESESHEEGRDRAVFFRESVVPAMQALRKPVDELEMIVDKDMWPMPSYGDLIFEV